MSWTRRGRPHEPRPVPEERKGILYRRKLIVFVLSLAVFLSAAVASGRSMSLDRYRTAIHNQHDWTNRALENRCLERVHLDDFTKTPLRSVLPAWRDDHVGYAKARHHRAQARDSSCLRDELMGWYYASGAKCVHEHEGAWTSNTGNGYYGGFQADMSFQMSYNPGAYATWGTANNWPPIEQIEMAYNGWKARGWYPWPNTARACGLL